MAKPEETERVCRSCFTKKPIGEFSCKRSNGAVSTTRQCHECGRREHRERVAASLRDPSKPPCSIDGCDRLTRNKSEPHLCNMHYQRSRKGIDNAKPIKGLATEHVTVNGVESKLCLTCLKILPIQSFGRFGRARDGRQEHCKPCRQAKKSSDWYSNLDVNRSRLREKIRTEPWRRLLSNAKDRAKKCGVPFEISKAHVSIPECCPVLGIPLVLGSGKCTGNSPSLDRLRPELGYVPGNVFVISHKANTIKQNATPAELMAVVKWLDSPSRQSPLHIPDRNNAQRMIHAAKKRAKDRGVPFSLSAEDITIPFFCPILGIPLSPGKGTIHAGSPSLDRLVPDLGYVPSNVAVISMRANAIKSNASASDIRRVAQWVRLSLGKTSGLPLAA